MKKVLAILTVLVFFVAVSAPVYSATESTNAITIVKGDEPKKEEAKKADTNKEEKSADCQAKAEKKSKEAKKEKTCGDKGKK